MRRKIKMFGFMRFKIGEKVRICRDGMLYPSYDVMASLMKAKKWRSKDCQKNFKGRTGVIKIFKSHERMKWQKLALIDLGPEELIIGIEGLSKINKCQKCPDKFRCLTGEDNV